MNVIQDMINKGRLEFPGEKEAVLISEDSFPSVASINTVSFDFKALTNLKNTVRIPPCPKIRRYGFLSNT